MSPVPNISVVLITRNEAKILDRALDSVAWAPEIVVLDSESTDATREIAARHGARVFSRAFTDYADQRNAALEKARGDWVLFLDADEVVTPELGREIQRIVARAWDPGDSVAYAIPFRNFLGTRWIRHGGLYPDYHVRLFRRELGMFRGRIHETLQIEGPRGRLRATIDHFTYRDAHHLLDKVERYAPQEGRARARAGESRWLLLLRVPFRFFQVYVLRQGFRDGKLGLFHATALTRYAWIVYRTARRQYQREAREREIEREREAERALAEERRRELVRERGFDTERPGRERARRPEDERAEGPEDGGDGAGGNEPR